MRYRINVLMDDGEEFTVETDARDLRAWEAERGTSWLATTLSLTELAQVSYLAAKRTGVLNGRYPTFESFEPHCVDTDGRAIAPPIGNPTQPDRTGDSLPPLRSGSEPPSLP